MSLERRLARNQQTEVKDAGLALQREPGRKRLRQERVLRTGAREQQEQGAESRSKLPGAHQHLDRGGTAVQPLCTQHPGVHPMHIQMKKAAAWFMSGVPGQRQSQMVPLVL